MTFIKVTDIKCIFHLLLLSIFKFSLLVVELLIIHGGFLVLLVLGDEVVHVRLGLSELHLVHALT